MKKYKEFFNEVQEVTRRAILSECHPFLKHTGEELSRLLKLAPWESNTGSLLAPPVLEHKPDWKSHDECMEDLAIRGFLQKSLVSAMNEASHDSFPKTRPPYIHQYNMWKALKDDHIRSAVITSGTGSGKTESFLVPILDDLARQAEHARSSLEGVQALFLYPLNALISSQKKRLDGWTGPFGGKIRYCLYNSLLVNQLSAERKRALSKQYVPDRASLRSSPPPVLITNASMLEHMLIRPEDQPIMQKSKGKLKWIVLDEAHTYVGAQAAEMALMLRRVLIAFDVKVSDVKFVATSATLEDDPKKKVELREFIANLSGCLPDQVHIETGQAVNSKVSADYRHSKHPVVHKVLSSPLLIDNYETLEIADTLGQAFEEGKLLRTRVHLFHRELNGIWACLNPKCQGLKETKLKTEEWPYGSIFTQQLPSCPHCSSKVLELLACRSCGAPHLIAEKLGNSLSQSRTVASFVSENDPSFQALQEEDENSDTIAASINKNQYANHVIIGTKDQAPKDVRKYYISPKEGSFVNFDGPEDFEAAVQEISALDLSTGIQCTGCHAAVEAKDKLTNKLMEDLFAKAYVGKQFLSNALTPVLLRFNENQEDADLTEQRLITFTDSRQGVAKSAAQLDQEMSRVFLRGQVFQRSLTDLGDGNNLEGIKKLEDIIKNDPSMEPLLGEKLASLKCSGTISWSEMMETLKTSLSMVPLKESYSIKDPQFNGTNTVAKFLLMREFARYSAGGRTLENIGLISVVYPALTDKILEESKPALFAKIEDWSDFLHIFLNHYMRGNIAIKFEENLLYHAFRKQKPNSLLDPANKKKKEPFDKLWPEAKEELPKDYLTKLLCAYGNLSPDISKHHRNQIDEVYIKAFQALTSADILFGIDGRGYQIKPEKMAFKIPEKLFLCPEKKVLRAFALGGITYSSKPSKAEEITFPNWVTFTQLDKKKGEEALESYRLRGLWTSSHDRVLEKLPYLRSVEHSAQVPRNMLEDYEERFNADKPSVQILNCSTTMEMGVDLAGVQTVLMNNVPPKTANYMQRIGRAGRRSEAKSIAYTMCSTRPHDLSVFRNPMWPFITPISTHPLSFKNKMMVQKHINAYLLGQFLLKKNFNAMKMNNKSFFYSEDITESVYHKFYDWLEDEAAEECKAELMKIISGTALMSATLAEVIGSTKKIITEIKVNWTNSWNSLNQVLEGLESDSPSGRGIKYQIELLSDEHLITALVNQTFLPGHGFPTNVVPFKYKIPEKQRGGDSKSPPGYPTRSMAVALREYAPGNELMLNGLVYKVKGITLNWKIPLGEDEDQHQEIQDLSYSWFCNSCGHNDASSKLLVTECPECKSTVDSIRYLKPRGFSVDFREKPSETSATQLYPHIYEHPHINFRHEWTEIGVQNKFCLLTDMAAQITTLSVGTKRESYDLCLCCGLVEEHSDAMKNHYPLYMVGGKRGVSAGRNDQGRCKANDDTEYRIQHKIALGAAEVHPTIVIQHPRLITEGDALTLAVALNQKIAEILGIEEDELSFLVKECPQKLKKYSKANYYMAIYDTTAGGAGHIESAGHIITKAVDDAMNLLHHCDCQKACSKCLISPNYQRYWDQLDRRAFVLNTEEVLSS